MGIAYNVETIESKLLSEGIKES